MNEYFTPNINFIVDCATSDLVTLKRLLLNCTVTQLRAVVEAVINAEQLTCNKACQKLAQSLTESLLNSSEGLWRDVLQSNSNALRTILAEIATAFIQEELLHVLCCDHEDL